MEETKKIQTVTGVKSADELGIVMSHEHFFWGWQGWLGDSTFAETHEEIMEALQSEIESIKDAGVKTVIDATTNEAGRDPVLLKKLSERYDINIICQTGYYNQEYGSSTYFKRRRAFGCDVNSELREMYERELYEGIGNTGIRAGILKLATSEEGITRYEEMFFKAACEVASKNRDVRIFVHHASDSGLKQTSQYFLEHGVAPRQVYLGHVCCSSDLKKQIELAKQGFFLGYDQFGMKTSIHSDNEVRIRQIIELIDAGCEDNLLISTDRTRHDLGRPNVYPNDRYNKFFITDKWRYLFDYVIPAMEKLGLTGAQKDKLLRTNPAHYLCDSFELNGGGT